MKTNPFHAMLVLLLCLLMAIPMAAQAEGERYNVILPGADSGMSAYPVVYVLPQDGYTQDNSGVAEKLSAAMAAGEMAPMIIVQPSFDSGADVIAEMAKLVDEIDATQPTVGAKEYRAVVGTGVGGYLAYVLALEENSPFGLVASIRGDFASEENPWLAAYGSVMERMETLHAANEAYFDTLYTYMDAPVDDDWTNMAGSTNDMGALLIGYGTGSAFHEYTVRPGEFTDEFLTESIARVGDRLTEKMFAGVAVGSVSLEKTTLTADDATANVHYTIHLCETFEKFVSVEPEARPAKTAEIEVMITLVDPKTGEVTAETTHTHAVSGAGEYTGTTPIDNNVAGTSAMVNLAVKALGTTQQLAAATLIRSQEPYVNGDIQKIELLGDWYFNYVGAQTVLDVAALKPEEYTAWSVVQPTLGNWEKGYGNISDENVTSGYGPDYFNYFIVGSGYYAKTFVIPENFDAKELILSAGYIDDRCEVFLNGVRVGATGMDETGQSTGETTWAVFSHFEIDPSLLNIGGENTMVVRAWNDLPFGAGGWYGGPVGLYSKAAFEAEYAEGASSRFYEERFDSACVASAKGESGTAENQYLIYLPEGYETSGRSYPTVYLLHQFNSDHTSYRTDKVDQLLDAGVAAGLFDEMIVVIPNSSEESWWTGDWEKMITEELIPLIDSKYRTIRDARYRLTAGCSMGGQGAYAVALRNPDFFTGAISFFGAFSYGGENSPNAIAAAESAEYLDYFTMYFICGNQDSYGFGVPAIALNQQLESMGVEHGFFIDNGGHDSGFYVPFFDDAFAYARANMYQSDEAVEGLLCGSLTIDGADVVAELTADAGIAAYMHSIPASSYTKNASPALSVPLTIEIAQDGAVVFTAELRDTAISADDLTQTVQIDLAGRTDEAKPASITLKAQIFDRVVTLATMEIPAK